MELGEVRQELGALPMGMVVVAFRGFRRHQHPWREDFFPRVSVGICHSSRGVTKIMSR